MQLAVLFLLLNQLHIQVLHVLPQRLLHGVIQFVLLFLFIAEQEGSLDQVHHVLELIEQANDSLNVVELPVVHVRGKGPGLLKVIRLIVEGARQELLVLHEFVYFFVEVLCLAVDVDVLALAALKLNVQVGPAHQLLVADALVDLLANVVLDVEQLADGHEFLVVGHARALLQHLVDLLLQHSALAPPHQLVV